MTEHKYPWKWNLTDLKNVEKNGCKVFSCFSCGGGSTMGYKLAGYEVLGNCEIDPAMMKIYKANHHPKYSFLMDIRDFLNEEVPDELKHLDILDGSPPCSVFSMAGGREKGWNQEKKFREGQKEQRLDDLFFWFIEVARKLQPKVVIAENVVGIIQGNAKGYMNEIIKAFDIAGYKVQIFKLNAAAMGVPQKRERVFFICQRKDLNFPKIQMAFKEKPITFGEVRDERGEAPQNGQNPTWYRLLKKRTKEDYCMADINKRVKNKGSDFNSRIWHDEDPCPTVPSSGNAYRYYDGLKCTKKDFISAQTFPQDYDFKDQQPKYVCGMSVPPVMMAQISNQVYGQWLKR